MTASVTRLADEIVARLVAAADPGRAEQERRYLKSELTFLGTSYFQTGRIAHEVATRERLDRDGTLALAETLWGPPVFERRAAAATVLEVGAGTLRGADLPFLERLLRESGTWALVDDLAANTVGSIVAGDPGGSRPTLDRWARDADFWVRRASLLGELTVLKQGGSLEPFACRADALLDEREFFIRKAIGWVLREVGKRRPAEVVAWVEPRAARASGVTMREAVKHLPAEDAERLMTAYRAGHGRRTAAGPIGPGSPPRTRRTPGRG